MGKTPEELAHWDDFMWSWAMQNVSRDFQELEKLLFSFMDTLTTWLQPEIKLKMSKMAKEMPRADIYQYVADLREGGASDEYIQKELKQIQAEHTDEDFDEMQVLKAPNK